MLVLKLYTSHGHQQILKIFNLHKTSFIVTLLICYTCTICTFTSAAHSPGTGLEKVIAELQAIDSTGGAVPAQLEDKESSKLVINLLYTTAEIICTHQSNDGKQQESLVVVHFDYSHILPASSIIFDYSVHEWKIDGVARFPLEISLYPEIPPPERTV